MTREPSGQGNWTRRAWLAAAVGGGAMATGIGVARLLDGPAPRPEIEGFLWPDPPALEPFALERADGEPFTLDALQGRWTFLFFGYTYCPDVCPATLAVLKRMLSTLRAHGTAERVQVAMVSVDPARDAGERLGEYVRYFDPTFLGITGPIPAIDSLTRSLGVVYRVGEKNDDGGYLVDHTVSVLLVDPNGRLVGLFGAPHRAQDMATRFEAMRAHVESHS